MASSGRRDFAAAVKALHSIINRGAHLETKFRSREQVVSAMHVYLKQLHLDPDKLSVIHIAGTKGKGSTAAMCESILRQGGLTTGLFTSPHLVDVRERFRLNGKPTTEEKFLTHFWRCWDSLIENKQTETFPGFFHFLTLIGFSLFIEEKVDVVVLEVGMGGRLDATNVVAKPVVCGITKLDYDHTHVLGNTIELIAGEKAGILKPGVPAFTVPQLLGGNDTLQNIADSVGAPLTLVDADWMTSRLQRSDIIDLGIKAPYQVENAAMAAALCESYFAKRQGFEYPALTKNTPLSSVIIKGLQQCSWPGRAQQVSLIPRSRDGKYVHMFLDGAHTALSMQSCAEWLEHATKEQSRISGPPQKRILLFNCTHEKNPVNLLIPLMQLPIDEIHIAPVDMGKPSRLAFRTAASLLKEHDAFTPIHGTTMFEEVIDSLPTYETSEDNLIWQKTIRDIALKLPTLLQHSAATGKIRVHAPPTFVHNNIDTALNTILCGNDEELEMGTVLEKVSAEYSLTTNDDEEPPKPTLMKEAKSTQHVEQKCDNIHIYVCGSLYTVGNTLEKIGWKPE